MFARIATGWELMKQSFSVLKEDKELVIFPILSGLACLLVLASFAVPLYATDSLQQVLGDGEDGTRNPLAYVVMFAFYVVNYFAIVFFNAALVSCALRRMEGGDPTVGYGLQQATARLPQIVAWAVLSATVGVVLKAIESRSEWVGRLVTSLVGAAWAIATYFVVPVLVVEQAGPVQALKRSASIMRKTWGETLVGKMGLGLVTLVAMLPGIAAIMLGITVGGASGQGWLAGAGIALGVVWILAVSLVASAMQSILLTALYLYATEGKAPPQFDATLLQSAFGSKK
jgi:Family of unknown function (DUF6159)